MSPLIFYARAGSQILRGQMSGPASVAFITPYSTNQPPGTVPLQYSLNGQDFLNCGHNLTYDQAIPTMDREVAWIPTPIIYFVTPATIIDGVSVRVSVVGEHFQFTSTCVLGEALVPIPTVFVSSTEVHSSHAHFLHYFCISRYLGYLRPFKSFVCMLHSFTYPHHTIINSYCLLSSIECSLSYIHCSYRASYLYICLARIL